MTQESDKMLSRLMDITSGLGLKHLAGSWQKRFEELQRNEVNVVLLGEFNHGKSSLINALVGEKVLPYGVTPTTKIDTYIRFGCPQRNVTASYCGQIVKTWNWDEWQKFCRVINQEDDIVFDRIDIELESKPFGPACVFIDTPGLNEASLTRENFVDKYTSRADILLFVLDASQAISRSEHAILKNLSETEHKPGDILFVINKSDRLDDEELLEVCAFVEQSLSPMFGNEIFYMVSSRHPEESELDLLKDRIVDDISKLSRDLLHSSTKRVVREMVCILRTFLILHRIVFALNPDKISSFQAKLNHARESYSYSIFDTLVDLVSNHFAHCFVIVDNDIDVFSKEFIEAMPREIDKSSISDVENYFEDYIDEEFRDCSNRVKESLNRQMEQLFVRLCRCIFNEPDSNTDDFKGHDAENVFNYDHVNRMFSHLLSTGAFDGSKSIFLIDYGIVGTLTGRISHYRKDSLKSMAEQAIRQRSDQLKSCFRRDLEQFRSMLSLTLIETGAHLFEHLSDLLECKDPPELEKIEDIDAELSSLLFSQFTDPDH